MAVPSTIPGPRISPGLTGEPVTVDRIRTIASGSLTFLGTLHDVVHITRIGTLIHVGTVHRVVSGSVGILDQPIQVEGVISHVAEITYIGSIGHLLSGSVGITNFPSDYPDSATQATLTEIKNKIGGTIDTSAVHITSGSINVSNFPTDYPDSVTQTILTEIKNKIVGSIDTSAVHVSSGSVGVLDQPIQVHGSINVSNFPSDYPDSAAQATLTEIKNKISGTLDTSAVHVTSGSINVNNFPSDYPDSTAHTLLTDIKTELSGTLDVSIANQPVQVHGTVATLGGGSVHVTGGSVGIHGSVNIIGGAGGPGSVGIKDYSGSVINPAERERQEEFIKLIDELIKRIPINDNFHFPTDVMNKVDSKVTHIKDKKFSFNYDEAIWNEINAKIQNINISNLTFV